LLWEGGCTQAPLTVAANLTRNLHCGRSTTRFMYVVQLLNIAKL
jgi:hypothetical protein